MSCRWKMTSTILATSAASFLGISRLDAYIFSIRVSSLHSVCNPINFPTLRNARQIMLMAVNAQKAS